MREGNKQGQGRRRSGQPRKARKADHFTSYYIPPEMQSALSQLATAMDRSMSSLVREAIKRTWNIG